MNLPSSLLRPFALCALSLLLLASLAQAAPTPNAPAPDFTLRTTEGRNLRLQEQRGQVVLLNFWATWCAPCREEMPQLGKLYERYQGAGFQLLGVNVDEDPAAAAALAQKLGVKFPVLLDSAKQVSKLYELNSMPSTVLIDRDGKVRFLHRGYRAGFEQTYDQQIRALLKE
ncbi:MAG TPA: TlpA disulfide reductase family protein [Ideonella sp.]|uniref:TlpA disulfide reductase family protein n=1 Tax=Ideonella sp. TaxID=1929293 RepID=UPI002C8F3209|nr:TlpA disulfide reductase family protein [Ideonella sp.]HSI51381.1 TlpA disulfide reductase family protein [Ideonella sp.]